MSPRTGGVVQTYQVYYGKIIGSAIGVFMLFHRQPARHVSQQIWVDLHGGRTCTKCIPTSLA